MRRPWRERLPSFVRSSENPSRVVNKKLHRTISLCLVTPLLAAFPLLAGPADAASQVEVALAEAGKAHKRGKHEKEHRILSEAAESASSVVLLHTLARTSLELGRMREGVQRAQQAYSLSTDSVQRSAAAVLIGNVYLEVASDGGLEEQGSESGRERFRKAAEWFGIAVEDQPQSGPIWTRLALALASAGDYVEAQSAARTAMEATATPPCQDHLRHLVSAWEAMSSALTVDVHQTLPTPIAIQKATPKFPASARSAKTQGAMMWSVLVNDEGSVASSCALKSLPDGLTEATQRAVDTWTFEPLAVNGHAIPFSFLMTVTFSIDGS